MPLNKLNPVQMEAHQGYLKVQFGGYRARNVPWSQIKEVVQVEQAMLLRYGFFRFQVYAIANDAFQSPEDRTRFLQILESKQLYSMSAKNSG